MPYHHHRTTPADRLCRPVRRHHEAPTQHEPGGFVFIVLGSSLAVLLVALVIAMLGQ